MRIIAKQEGNRYLVQLHEDELANLIGEYSMCSVSREIKDKFKEGAEVNISKIYSQHRGIKELQDSKKYQNAKKELQKMINALEPIQGLIEAMNSQVEKKL